MREADLGKIMLPGGCLRVGGGSNPAFNIRYRLVKWLGLIESSKSPNDSMALFGARLICGRLEVELAFTLLIKETIRSRTAATHVHPVARHDHD
jgi:hypothetical protein